MCLILLSIQKKQKKNFANPPPKPTNQNQTSRTMSNLSKGSFHMEFDALREEYERETRLRTDEYHQTQRQLLLLSARQCDLMNWMEEQQRMQSFHSAGSSSHSMKDHTSPQQQPPRNRNENPITIDLRLAKYLGINSNEVYTYNLLKKKMDEHITKNKQIIHDETTGKNVCYIVVNEELANLYTESRIEGKQVSPVIVNGAKIRNIELAAFLQGLYIKQGDPVKIDTALAQLLHIDTSSQSYSFTQLKNIMEGYVLHHNLKTIVSDPTGKRVSYIVINKRLAEFYAECRLQEKNVAPSLCNNGTKIQFNELDMLLRGLYVQEKAVKKTATTTTTKPTAHPIQPIHPTQPTETLMEQTPTPTPSPSQNQNQNQPARKRKLEGQQGQEGETGTTKRMHETVMA